MGSAQPESSAVPTRRLEFDAWLGDVPRHFAGHGPITTEIIPAPEFYFAEDYHQQYLSKVPHGYCGLGGTGVSCPMPTGVAAAE